MPKITQIYLYITIIYLSFHMGSSDTYMFFFDHVGNLGKTSCQIKNDSCTAQPDHFIFSILGVGGGF